VWTGEVVGVLESVMYNGEGDEEPAGSDLVMDWENGTQVDCCSWEEYQHNLRQHIFREI
jgi:hypothetical protein